MIKSMTGFGNILLSNSLYSLTIDIKSINSRYLDCKIKLPKQIEQYEVDIIARDEKK